MNIDKSDTAVVFIDPQNEVLSERGLAWPLVHESLTKTILSRIWNASSKLRRRMASKFSSRRTISIPPIKDGNSTGHSKPMKPPTAISRAKES